MLIADLIVKSDATNEVSISLRARHAKGFPKEPLVHLAPLGYPQQKPWMATLVYSAKFQLLSLCKEKTVVKPGFGALPGKRKFTKRAAHTLREGAAIIQRDFGKQAVFLTGTIPMDTLEAIKCVARYSAYIVQRVNKWLRDWVPGAHVLSCWEYQKRGALHNHVVVASEDRGALQVVANKWHIFWCHLLDTVQHRSGVQLSEGVGVLRQTVRYGRVITDAQWVLKEVGRYLSKYISKTASKAANDRAYNPTRWWSVSRTVFDKIVAARVVLSSRDCHYIGADEWFAKLAGDLCETAQQVYSVVNPYATSDRKIITYQPPNMVRDLVEGIAKQFHNVEKRADFLADVTSCFRDLIVITSSGLRIATSGVLTPLRRQSHSDTC